MSSRVFRGDAAAEALPITWRRAGSPAETYHHNAPRNTPQQHIATQSVAEIHAEVERQMQARIALAREQGSAEAEIAAQQGAAERAQPVLAAFQKMTEELASQGHRLRAEAERDTVKLAVVIARKILHREIALDPEVVLGLVKAAFAKVEARETHRLRVSPSDAALLHDHRQSLHLPQAVEIVADRSLQQGSVIFETSRGDLDATIETQLAEIERGLADVVRRRLQ